MRRAALWRVARLAAIGATAFWLPDVVWHVARGDRFDRFDVLGVTILMPLTLLTAYVVLRRASQPAAQKLRGWPLLLGVWELGGYFMFLSWTFQHAGFTTMHGASDAAMAVLLPLIPIYTLIMATYDGSLGALIIASLAGLVIFLVGLSRQSVQ